MRGRKYAWGKPDERKMRGETQKRKSIGAKFGNSVIQLWLLQITSDFDCYHYVWSYCYNSIKDTILSVFRNSWPEIVSGELSDLLYLGSNSFWSKSGTLKALYLLHFGLIRRPRSFRKKLWLCPTRGGANSKTGWLTNPGCRWISAPWI